MPRTARSGRSLMLMNGCCSSPRIVSATPNKLKRSRRTRISQKSSGRTGEMTGEVIVRPAAIGDAHEIAHLSGQLGYPVAGEAMAHRLKSALARNDQLLLVAEIGGKVGGWLQAQSAEIIESGFRVEIVG